MDQFGKILIIIGAVTLLFGLALLLGGRFGLGRLPGDIVIQRENFTFFFPLMTGIVISIVLSLVLFIFGRLR
jgi:hypothetical protein